MLVRKALQRGDEISKFCALPFTTFIGTMVHCPKCRQWSYLEKPSRAKGGLPAKKRTGSERRR
jgi:hypothetical protein